MYSIDPAKFNSDSPFAFRGSMILPSAEQIHLRHEFCNWRLPCEYRLPQYLSIPSEGSPKVSTMRVVRGNIPSSYFSQK